jgi:phosphodiesterase/alkaline phosphatase D-like protein
LSAGSAVRSARHLAIAAALAALVPLALAVSPASASFVHTIQTASFGVDGTSGTTFSNQIRAVAVDKNTHHLYVEDDSGTPKIYGFDTTSTPTPYAPLTGNFPITVEAGGPYAGMSVDGANGKLYYSGTGGTGKIAGFDSAGSALGGNFPIDPTYPAGVSEYICGSAVDAGGSIWVGNFYSKPIFRYTSAGVFTGTADGTASSTPCRLAFDQSNDDMYVGEYSGSTRRYPNSSGYTESTPIQFGQTTGIAVDSNTHTVYIAGSSSVSAYEPNGKLIETFGTGLGASWTGVAVDSTTGNVYLTDANGGGKVRVFPGISVPDATMASVSNLTRTSVTLRGHADPAGAGNIVDCHFDYGTDTSYGSGSVGCRDGNGTVVGTPGNPITTQTDVHADVSGLTADTGYHFRLVVANASYPHPGEDATFRTPIAVGGVTTGVATGITKFSATLNGVYNGDGADIQYLFEYGLDTKYGKTTAAPPGVSNGTGTGPQSVSANLTGLEANGTYHYRLVAHNAFGYNYGPDKILVTTPPDLPVVDSASASSVTQSSATLNSSINPGSGATVYRFQYGLTTTYGSQTYPGGPTAADEQFHTASADISELTSGTTYHFRVRATNFGGTTVGPDQTFTTPGPPLVDAFTAFAITQTSATLGAQVNPNLSPTSYHFDYGTSDSYGSSTPESAAIGADSLGHPASAAISGLAPGTTYHYRIVATNAVMATAGSDQAFTTVAAPPAVVPPTKCKAGFVKKGGKCVKKRHHKRRGAKHG